MTMVIKTPDDEKNAEVARAHLAELRQREAEARAEIARIEAAHPGLAARSGVLDRAWEKRSHDWFIKPPPPRKYLFATHATNERDTIGLMPLGRVGLLATPGGAGKSFLMTGAALSVASGACWLNHFTVNFPGKVLMLMGEEDPEELGRRLYHTAHCMGLTAAMAAEAMRNIDALPLYGEHVALIRATDEMNGGIDKSSLEAIQTDIARDLLRRVSQDDYRLIILDPLSRFAGPDTEKDNAAATRFVQCLERLAQAPSSPVVVAVHHTNKAAAAVGETDANAARGASALKDGARWQMNLDTQPHRDGGRRADHNILKLTFTKANYSAPMDPVWLFREPKHEGALRVATPHERKDYEAAAEHAEQIKPKTGESTGKVRPINSARHKKQQAEMDAMVRGRFDGRTLDDDA